MTDLKTATVAMAFAQIMQKVNTLPDTADGIAQLLTTECVTGTQHSTKDNPLAVYLRDVGEGLGEVAVWDDCVVADDVNEDWNLAGEFLEHVGEFLRRFHKGEYPELIA